ncbi:hypothetical protein [Bdellovibrio sp. HCB209]|uniref:hypothetical protein n=1 Tax=Bdellovibrio sp. HCB209 TaxID=3394354 RepID=UPI0039B56410
MPETIYVKLVGGEVPVWRPVLANKIQSDVYKILPSPSNHMPLGEQWEFVPGSLVEVKEKLMDNQFVKVAVSSNFLIG